jgi:hypothetical protein
MMLTRWTVFATHTLPTSRRSTAQSSQLPSLIVVPKRTKHPLSQPTKQPVSSLTIKKTDVAPLLEHGALGWLL